MLGRQVCFDTILNSGACKVLKRLNWCLAGSIDACTLWCHLSQLTLLNTFPHQNSWGDSHLLATEIDGISTQPACIHLAGKWGLGWWQDRSSGLLESVKVWFVSSVCYRWGGGYRMFIETVLPVCWDWGAEVDVLLWNVKSALFILQASININSAFQWPHINLYTPLSR